MRFAETAGTALFAELGLGVRHALVAGGAGEGVAAFLCDFPGRVQLVVARFVARFDGLLGGLGVGARGNQRGLRLGLADVLVVARQAGAFRLVAVVLGVGDAHA